MTRLVAMETQFILPLTRLAGTFLGYPSSSLSCSLSTSLLLLLPFGSLTCLRVRSFGRLCNWHRLFRTAHCFLSILEQVYQFNVSMLLVRKQKIHSELIKRRGQGMKNQIFIQLVLVDFTERLKALDSLDHLETMLQDIATFPKFSAIQLTCDRIP